MKTGRGWWALAGFGLLTLMLLLYVGAYFWLVQPHAYLGRGVSWRVPEYPRSELIDLGWFFCPVHQIDRNWISREFWAVQHWSGEREPSGPDDPPPL